jgi:hypothetical protein
VAVSTGDRWCLREAKCGRLQLNYHCNRGPPSLSCATVKDARQRAHLCHASRLAHGKMVVCCASLTAAHDREK